MGNFTPVGFFDTSRFMATYLLHYRNALVDSPDPTHVNVRSFDLVRDSQPAEAIADWRAAKGMLQRIEAALVVPDRPGSIINAFIVALGPGGQIGWHKQDYPGDVLLAHIALIPAPESFILCGLESTVLPVSYAHVINHRQMISEFNAGDKYTAHKLVLEIGFDPVPA